ncbi:hypothetical protein BDW22DRAFT_337855 [Trametopsis cervina]|nr:hypothetical protein BDW22DRAFT_337855 [Trametopsis cervina]
MIARRSSRNLWKSNLKFIQVHRAVHRDLSLMIHRKFQGRCVSPCSAQPISGSEAILSAHPRRLISVVIWHVPDDTKHLTKSAVFVLLTVYLRCVCSPLACCTRDHAKVALARQTPDTARRRCQCAKPTSCRTREFSAYKLVRAPSALLSGNPGCPPTVCFFSARSISDGARFVFARKPVQWVDESHHREAAPQSS